MGTIARLGTWLAVLWLATACAGMAGPSYWDPERGARIDPLSGQPLYGGGR